MLRILEILEPSKMTVRRIQVQVGTYEMDDEEEFQVFKSFPNLNVLNVSPYTFPRANINYQLPGLLTSLGLHLPDDEWFSFQKEDLDWSRNLKRLMITFEDPPNGIPSTLWTIAEACWENLVELTTDMSSEEEDGSREDGYVLDLPNLKFLRMLKADCQASDSFKGLLFPKLLGISASVEVKSCLQFNVVHWLELFVSKETKDSSLQYGKASILLLASTTFHAGLKILKVSTKGFPTDFLVDLLMVKKQDGSRNFPKLSKLYLSGSRLPEMELLVAMMISRRLSKFIDGSCEAITLYLHSKKIVAFRKLEDEMLSRKSIGGERLIGKSLLRNLEEWRDYTLD